MCVCVWAHMCYGTHVEITGQVALVGFLYMWVSGIKPRSLGLTAGAATLLLAYLPLLQIYHLLNRISMKFGLLENLTSALNTDIFSLTHTSTHTLTLILNTYLQRHLTKPNLLS